ncbi:F-box domain [Macleaya cordata]|uniref:F-box domain n=1 Tax=Macleaya cordata TaxID=56857 RepID=A0A200QH71_MACCD|nr:F-box domain [Macleaya cordata]
MSSVLPDDIIVNIFSRLPVKSILRFRCVCKPWCKLFKSPNFVKMHLNHGVEKEKFSLILIDNEVLMYSMDYYDSSLTSSTYYEAVEIDYPFKSLGNEVHIRGACNGLLCIEPRRVKGELICIWNPSTKEYKEIPMPEDEKFPSHLDIDHSEISYGFGYDCNIEDYKLVRVMNFYGIDNDGEKVFYGCEVKVFTLGSNSWKHIPSIYPYDIYFDGVLVNGALHWRATPWIGGSKGADAIVSFDIGHERLTEVSPLVSLDDKFYKTVGVVGGCLCIFAQSYNVGIEVWVMKDYGVRESWTKLFTIAQQSILGSRAYKYLSPMQSLKNGEILLKILLRIGEEDDLDLDYDLALYDPKLARFRTLKICGGEWSDATLYVESLVSLNTGKTVKGSESISSHQEIGIVCKNSVCSKQFLPSNQKLV